ncbi:hypothetical protein [Hydrogenobacter thermophilus]|uniref:hypothetical protein n=1 Tax=Hydrogenobacter thermophilus TaxID=940 RepID=UPI0030FA8630
MIRPAGFVRLTPLYILLSLILITLSPFLELAKKPYIDLLLFIAFPSLIKGSLFQLYPTLQGKPIRGGRLIYFHFLLNILNAFYFLLNYEINQLLYTADNLLFLLLILLNTHRLSDPSVVFLFVGSLYTPLVCLLMWFEQNPLLIKHAITSGFFLNVITGSYYVFVPMLQIEELWRPKLRWLNLLLLNLSSLFVLYCFYLKNYTLIAYGGSGVLISMLLLFLIIYKTLSQRRSPLKGLDISVKFLLLGLFFFTFFLSVGISSAGSQNFGFISWHKEGMLYGFLTFITVGATYHIVPFMLWWRVYAPKMGKEKIPTLKELLKPETLEIFLLLGIPTFTLSLVFKPFNEPLSNLLLIGFSLVLLYYTLKLIPLVSRL